MKKPLKSVLARYGVTIFTEINRLAAEHQALNLSQGFPDFDGPDFIKEAAARAMREGHNQYAPSHGVPPNDWEEPDPAWPYESSAAAIAASGLLKLARISGDPIRARSFRQYALQIIDTLTTPEFLANETPGWEGILKHGMYHQRRGLGVDESVMWGDYFFVEAVSQVLDDE